MKTKTLHRVLASAATVLALAAGPIMLAGPALAAGSVAPAAGRTGTEKIWPTLPDHPAAAAYATKAAGLDSWVDEEELKNLTFRLMHDHKLSPSFAYSCDGHPTFAECMANANNLPYDKDTATALADEAARVTHMHRSTSADGEYVKIESFRPAMVNDDLELLPTQDGNANTWDLNYDDGTWKILVMRWTAGTKVSYQWFLDGKAIQGATGQTYHPRASDAGHLLSATATGRKDGWAPYTHKFDDYEVGTLDELDGGYEATAVGSAKIGATLTAKPGSWPSGTTLAYQWYRGSAAIARATSATYKTTAADAGKAVHVRITATKPGYAVMAVSTNSIQINKQDLAVGLPTVFGTAKVGQKLTAQTGSWTAGTSLSFQWYANGSGIHGANASTFTPTAGQRGKSITVKVTGSKPWFYTASATSKATAKVAPGTLATKTPAISGTAKVGQKLTAQTGSWTSGTKLSYQWLANGSGISGATASTFTPTASQRGNSIAVTVTGSKSGFNSASVTSMATAKVAPGTLAAKTPAVSGTAMVGKRLTAKAGTWTSGTKLSYQWLANGKPVSGATSSTFTPTASQRGKSITVRVTGTKSGYSAATQTSEATKRTANGTLATKTPSISGTAQVGKTLTAKTRSWTSGTKLSYQWYANGKVISKATKSTVKLVNAQRGKKITVKVTGRKSGHTTVSKLSKATKPAKAATKKPTPPSLFIDIKFEI